MLRKRSSLTEVKITILGKSFRQSSRKSKSPGRAIWLTAFEIKVPSRSRAKTFTFTSDSNIAVDKNPDGSPKAPCKAASYLRRKHQATENIFPIQGCCGN